MSRGSWIALLLLAPLAVLVAVVWRVASAGAGQGSRSYVQHVALPAVDQPRELPRIYGPQDASRPLVVIDPGHGGFDPGAGEGAVKEKAVALAIARALRDRLIEQGGIRVAMTREDDRFIPLSERPDLARRLGADLFVSIHADSAASEDARGASVYVLSDRGSSEAASRFAARENRADTINGVSLSKTSGTVGAILLDLSQREAQAGSLGAAELFLREMRGRLPLHHDAVESAALAVLKAPDIPSILFETGYISNVDDAEYLNSDEGRATIVDAAAQAIRVYFAREAGA